MREKLLKQLLQGKFSKEAQDCLKIYNFLFEEFDGRVWSREFDVLVTLCSRKGEILYYKPTKIGEIFLKGLEA